MIYNPAFNKPSLKNPSYQLPFNGPIFDMGSWVGQNAGTIGSLLGAGVGTLIAPGIGTQIGSQLGGQLGGMEQRQYMQNHPLNQVNPQMGSGGIYNEGGYNINLNPKFNPGAYGQWGAFKMGSEVCGDGGLPGAGKNKDGMVDINVEKNELEVNPKNGSIVKDFKDKPPHPEDESLIDIRGNVQSKEGNFIIPKKFRDRYLKGDFITKKTIIKQVMRDKDKKDAQDTDELIKKYGGAVMKMYKSGSFIWVQGMNDEPTFMQEGADGRAMGYGGAVPHQFQTMGSHNMQSVHGGMNVNNKGQVMKDGLYKDGSAIHAKLGDQWENEFMKKGGWIQKATASIHARGTEGVCTGAKFGSKTCPPGSRRYNLAKTFKAMAKKHEDGGGIQTPDQLGPNANMTQPDNSQAVAAVNVHAASAFGHMPTHLKKALHKHLVKHMKKMGDGGYSNGYDAGPVEQGQKDIEKSAGIRKLMRQFGMTPMFAGGGNINPDQMTGQTGTNMFGTMDMQPWQAAPGSMNWNIPQPPNFNASGEPAQSPNRLSPLGQGFQDPPLVQSTPPQVPQDNSVRTPQDMAIAENSMVGVPKQPGQPFPWKQTGQQVAAAAPSIYDLGMAAFQKPFQYNASNYTTKGRLPYRDIDFSPIKRGIEQQASVARQNALNGSAGSGGSYLSNTNQIAANTQNALATAMMNASHLNNQGRNAADEFNIGIDRGNNQMRFGIDQENRMNKAATTQGISKGLTGISGLTQQQMLQQSQQGQDQNMLKMYQALFPSLLNYGK